MSIKGISPPPEIEPDPPVPKKRRKIGKADVVIGVIVILAVVLWEMVDRPGGLFSRPTATPTATLTFSEWKAKAEEIPYKTLFRYAEDNTGKLVYYRGSVIQVMEGRGGLQLRVNVTPGGFGFWIDTVFLRYADPPVRVLEGDLIEFIGRMDGTHTYESIWGANITIPDLTVFSLIINSE